MERTCGASSAVISVLVGATAWLLGTTASAPPAAAQPGGTVGGVEQRHDELAKMKEALADPDPLVRLASMEAAVASGDATKTELVIRIAFASDDFAMRNLALRTWIASLKRLTVDVVLPGDLQKLVDQAVLDPKQAPSPVLKSEWLATWSAKTLQQTFEFSDVDMSKNTGKVIAIPTCCRYGPEDFTISGTQFTVSAWIPASDLRNGTRCTFRMSPSASLTLQGTMSCSFRTPSPRLNVTAQMF